MGNKNNNTQEIFNRIVDNLQIIIDNGDYEKFLKFQSNFKEYSFNNCVLIFSQFPEATRVAGKAKWLKLNRAVDKIAKKIWIVAPIPRKYQKKVKVIEDGREKEEIETITYNTYRYVYVYDISQTTGKVIPLETQDLNNDDMGYLYDKLKVFSHLPVEERNLEGSVKGYYSKTENLIAIKNTLSKNDKAAVLLHELAHSLYDDFDYSKDRNLSEVFVESIAYIVANHFGLDTSLCSFNYIIKWADGEPEKVIELGSKIQDCANKFIEKIEKFEKEKFASQERNKNMNALDYQEVKKHIDIMNVAYHLCLEIVEEKGFEIRCICPFCRI